MSINDISGAVVDAAIKVHSTLGPGLLESIYEIVLAHELRKRGLRVERQVIVPIRYDNLVFEEGFRADLVVEGRVLVEVKSVDELHDVHKKQVLTYLRLLDLKVGVLINFNTSLLKDGIKRIVNGLPE
jgi:GxxExxY protein